MNTWGNIKIKIPEYNQNTIQKIYTHLDYLRFSFTEPHDYFHKIINTIDNDNSNQFFDDEYSYSKLRLSMGNCLQIAVVYEGRAVPVMLYNEFDEKTQVITKRFWRLDFYWSFFRLSDLNLYDYNDKIKSILWEFETTTKIYISRIDVATDVFLKKQQYLPTISEIVGSSEIQRQYRPFYLKWWKFISCEIGNSDSLGVFSRVYHKTIELLQKWKGFLYRDYLTSWAVHRYEVQLWSRYCKRLQLQNIQNFLTQIREVMTSKLWNWKNIQSYYEYKEPARDRIKVDKYAKDILGRVATYASNGYNPYLLLQERLPTKISLDLANDYLHSFLLKQWKTLS